MCKLTQSWPTCEQLWELVGRAARSARLVQAARHPPPFLRLGGSRQHPSCHFQPPLSVIMITNHNQSGFFIFIIVTAFNVVLICTFVGFSHLAQRVGVSCGEVNTCNSLKGKTCCARWTTYCGHWKKLIVDFHDWGNLNAAIHLVFGLYPQQGVSLMIIMAYLISLASTSCVIMMIRMVIWLFTSMCLFVILDHLVFGR